MKFIREVKGLATYDLGHVREITDESAETVLKKADFKWAAVDDELESRLKKGVPANEVFPSPVDILAEKQVLEAERDQLQATIQKQLAELEALKKAAKAPKATKTDE